MVAKYAKDQPEGFVNRIQRVAIVGAGGQLGRHITEELLKTGQHTTTAVTRAGGNSTFPEGVIPAAVDYTDESALVSALKGQQFLIITLPHDAAPETHANIVEAAGKAGVPYVMPNVYTCDIVVNNKSLGNEVMLGQKLRPIVEHIEQVGKSSWTVLVTSLWYEFSLACPPDWFGFDVAKREVTFFDDGERKINTSSWPFIGKTVAAFLSLKELPENEDDDSLTVSSFQNKPLYTSSFFISQRDMLDSIHRVSGTSDKDWTIKKEASSKRVADGQALLATGDLRGLARMYYSRMFFPGTEGTYQDKLHTKALGLSEDDLDQATKRALAMVESNWRPM
ncbi:unnamed protein product [Clonostachys chloroleuca]|uniref:NmrA-like domain-containing protein n=1 Tax=Clonostachys chloroleuca TaxID=1926264 RepID=A0AA35QDX5_9HYPO|nr:unnamed protein product [Clonostachys chloroleuca]